MKLLESDDGLPDDFSGELNCGGVWILAGVDEFDFPRLELLSLRLGVFSLSLTFWISAWHFRRPLSTLLDRWSFIEWQRGEGALYRWHTGSSSVDSLSVLMLIRILEATVGSA